MREPLDVKLDYLTLTLDLVNNIAKDAASRAYEQECGASLRDLRLLRFIGSEPGLTLTRLIELASLEKTLASKAISTLVARGWVTRAVGARDARHISLELTDKGEAVVLCAEPIGRFMERKLLSRITRDELAVLRRCLDKLVATGTEMSGSIEQLLAQMEAQASA
ncbi:MarR family winged helix-turn-helix transcriptional regulator [Ramlibacter tataouinensis]|uniref:MarR family winged helix-turn-helix transcriptional regulator n=1 Tax=Ramlibacter tataouinensis TaxID=94132 RepID=UPI0022F3C045|nr:MarR family winged helix-turn-helix transcriptional regulator [Ramlibacter tataouinensis]WBY03032.1 MarR family winged helix-turn-helix transcriptional regulator [Ramlibacter tataouinensis]